MFLKHYPIDPKTLEIFTGVLEKMALDNGTTVIQEAMLFYKNAVQFPPTTKFQLETLYMARIIILHYANSVPKQQIIN